MNNLITFISLISFLILINSQPGPRVDINGMIYISYVTNWACTINLNTRGVPQYSETLSYSRPSTDNQLLATSNSDNLDSINWAGSSCNCWVEIFEHSYLNGESLGFWIGSTNGTIDLTLYNFLEDSDLIGDDDYAQWNTEVSSYAMYCF